MLEERYEIIKLLGKGRTGGVYQAEDATLGRKVALRRFFAETNKTDIAEYKADFENVAHSLSALQHPNLLRVYDAGVDDDGAYIISQLLKGETLHERIQEGAVPIWEVYELAQQMLDALIIAHNKGFLHGAITPGSIMMSPRARGGYLYVILDMGLCRLAPLIQGKDSILSIMADPAILAPELFDGSDATQRADLYMLGHILYLCIAGGHPFAGLPAEEAEKKHKEGLPPLQNYNAEVPDDFRLWIEKLTQFNPDDRQANAVDALNSLPKVSRQATTQSTGDSTTTTHPITNSSTQSQPQVQPQVLGISAPKLANPGPRSSVLPVNNNHALPSSVISGLPVVMKPKGSKIPLIVILILIAAIIMIILLSGNSGNQDVVKNETIIKHEDDKDSNTDQGSNRTKVEKNSGPTYASRNAVKEVKRIITDFDGTKSAANNRGWQYSAKAKQKAVTDGWSVNTGNSSPHPGIKFPIKSNENDLFDLGWRLTYIVRPVKGHHKLGIHLDKNLNPGWMGGDVCLYLVVNHTAKGIVLTARDPEHKVKSAKSITVPYNGANSWHTIVVEQKPEDTAGNYSVSIDGKAAFNDSFTRGKDFGSYNNHLFTYCVAKDPECQWVIKELKLETL